MITIIAALAVQLVAPDAQQASVRAYQDCLAPIVRANERAGSGEYRPLEEVLDRIRSQCSNEHAAAREALAEYVVATHSDLPRQPTDADKEELIRDATVRWANSIAHQLAAEADNEPNAQD